MCVGLTEPSHGQSPDLPTKEMKMRWVDTCVVRGKHIAETLIELYVEFACECIRLSFVVL